MLETHLRQAANALLESAILIAPPEVREWGQAMKGELDYVEGAWAAAMWALGGASVMAKHALISLFMPGRRGQGLVRNVGLFAKTVSLREAALVAGAACVLGALLFLAAPPFRQGIRVSLAAWRTVFRGTVSDGQPGLKAVAKGAESRRDPEGLAFCAVRLQDARESARLAEEAVRLDPSLIWVYAVVAARHPDLPKISQWLPQLERWDPQNALFPLIRAQSIDAEFALKASRLKLTPKELGREIEADPAWQSAMAAAFRSGKLDGYLDRVDELDRRVVRRYGFNDPFEVLSGPQNYEAPLYAFSDSHRFAKSLLQLGQNLEVRGDRRGAREKYWQVARFGQLLDSHGDTDVPYSAGPPLQVMAYERLRTLAEEDGNADEAALFGYLIRKLGHAPGEGSLPSIVRTEDGVGLRFNAAKEEDARQGWRWVFGQYVSGRNALFVQVAGLMMVACSGFLVVATPVLIFGGRQSARRAAQRAKSVATVVSLVSAVGLLLSSATLYLTYRPYWYLSQRAILEGGRSRTRDLRYFLEAAQIPPGFGHRYDLYLNFPVYFWTGVTLLGVMGIVLILLRHSPDCSRSDGLQHGPRVPSPSKDSA
jgi:hypothetical protein